jgi:putative ABC transport system substrate-binding protein
MRRREFITLVGGAASAWPLAARGQQTAMPVIGFLYLGSPEPFVSSLTAFRQGLSETGFIEGRNVTIEYRFARNEPDRVREFAAELVRRRVAVIVAPGFQAITAAKAATTTIPIVFTTGGDPVQSGLIVSLNRPGGNVTGATTILSELGGKQLGLLNELFPKAKRFAGLIDPLNPAVSDPFVADLKRAAATLGRDMEFFSARNNGEIDSAFASLAQAQPDAVVVNSSTLFNNRRVQIVTLAAHYRLPAIYADRTAAEIGGLMSYETSIGEENRQVGLYTGRILKGEKPADLPVMLPTKFEFIINLQTAKTLGISVPPTLLAIADEVIE